jgi:hypothetical protein
MVTKLVPHRRHELVLEVCVSARAEAFTEGRGYDPDGMQFHRVWYGWKM